MRLSIAFIVVLLTFSLHASDQEVFYSLQIKQLEKSLSKEARFESFMSWGETFESFYKSPAKAIVYYKKALGEKTTYNKLPTYFKIVRLSSLNKDYKTANKFFKKMKSYGRSHPVKGAENFLRMAEKSFFTLEENSKVLIGNTNKLKGSLLANARIHNYKARFLRKEYAKALRAIDIKDAVKSKNFEKQVEYDVLSFLTKKKNKPTCEAIYNKHKELMVINYTHMTCSLIMDYSSKGKITVSKFNDLKKLIDNHFPEKRYLISALKDLNT